MDVLFNSVLLTEVLDEDVKDVGKKVSKAYEWLGDQVPNIIKGILMVIIALVIFFIGRKLISLLVKGIGKSFEKAGMEEGVRKFICSCIKAALLIILIVAIAGFMGLETTSLAAVVGSAGLAIGLSLQGSLSNFAGGVLILMLKPFVVGDYISSNDKEGTVTNIDIFYTRITTIDNRVVVIPNGTLSNSVITNVTGHPDRRIDLIINVEYGQNIDKVREILERLAKENEMVDQEKPVEVYVDSFDKNAVSVGYRIWTAKENYWALRFDILEKIRNEFEKEGITIPFDQLDVHIKNEAR